MQRSVEETLDDKHSLAHVLGGIKEAYLADSCLQEVEAETPSAKKIEVVQTGCFGKIADLAVQIDSYARTAAQEETALSNKAMQLHTDYLEEKLCPVNREHSDHTVVPGLLEDIVEEMLLEHTVDQLDMVDRLDIEDMLREEAETLAKVQTIEEQNYHIQIHKSLLRHHSKDKVYTSGSRVQPRQNWKRTTLANFRMSLMKHHLLFEHLGTNQICQNQCEKVSWSIPRQSGCWGD